MNKEIITKSFQYFNVLPIPSWFYVVSNCVCLFICHAKSIGHFTQYLMNVNLKNYFVHNSRYFMMRRIDCAEM